MNEKAETQEAPLVEAPMESTSEDTTAPSASIVENLTGSKAASFIPENPNSTSKDVEKDENPHFSKNTRHKQEAEKIILDAMKDTKGSEEDYRKTVFNFATFTNNDDSSDDVDDTKISTPKPENKSGLAAKASLLQNLHKMGGLNSDSLKKVTGKDISEADSAERVRKAGWVLHRAANFRKKGTGSSLKADDPVFNNRPNEEDVEMGETGHDSKGSRHGLSFRARQAMHATASATMQEWSSLHDFFEPKKSTLISELTMYTACFLIPSLIISVILFYWADNPPTGRCTKENPAACSSRQASASWWVLFIWCRQTLIWMMSRWSDVIFVDFLILQHPMFVRLIGPRLSLILVQSKGWPSTLFWWGMWNAFLVYGAGDFKQHWLFWQDFADMFNEENPSGTVTSSDGLGDLIIIATVGATFVVLKRHWTGIHLGSRLYTRYRVRLEESLKEVLLISELSLWARRKRDQKITFLDYLQNYDDDPIDASSLLASTLTAEAEKAAKDESAAHKSVVDQGLIDLTSILEPWEEPKRKTTEQISGSKIIEFQQAFAVVTRPYFFSSAFGPVESREECAKSSEMLFRHIFKLLAHHDEKCVNFYHICNWMYRGCTTPEEKANAAEYLKLFDAKEDGKVYLVDFVVAIDRIYRKLRILENAVNNASHVDKAYEAIINVFFYIAWGLAALALLGLNVLEFLVGLSAFVVSFGFMIGSGTSQLFEGILMVLARQPYDVGDKIAMAMIDDPANKDGSMQWLVTEINLVSTTAKLMASGEVASFSNGALARARIINANRSPDPVVYIYARFATDVPFSKIMTFRKAIEKFIEQRPQEWKGMAGFRTSRVEVELNFVEYVIVLKHQTIWQNLIPILESKGEVAAFAVEAMKQLGCEYEAPKMGVEITMAGTEPVTLPGDQQKDEGAKQEQNLMELAQAFTSSKKDD